jgi:DNA-binding LacI/PurR family transcriptional regulator
VNPKRVTVYDIAEALGVSHTTVALALRNHHSISPKRRAQVQRTAKRLGYCRDPFLAMLTAQRHHLSPTKIQSALAWITNSGARDLRFRFKYVARLWQGARQAAERLGYHLDAIPWEPGITARRYQQILSARGIRGLLIGPQFHPPPGWQEIDFRRFSIVHCGRRSLSPDSNTVTADALRALQLAGPRCGIMGIGELASSSGK